MNTEHDSANDADLLLTAIAAGDPAPEGDDLAVLLAAWHADIVAEPLPTLRPATQPVLVPPAAARVPFPRRLFRRTSAPASTDGTQAGPDNTRPGRRRLSRPAIVAAAAAVLAFGGLTVASAAAQPGTPLWPITRVIFGDTAKTRLAEQEALKLLDQARAAISSGDKAKAAELVEAARVHIGQITDPGVKLRLTGEADALWNQILLLPGPIAPSALPSTPAPGQSGQPGGPTPTPTPAEGGGILPPLPSILPSLSPLLPSGILPDLPPLLPIGQPGI